MAAATRKGAQPPMPVTPMTSGPAAKQADHTKPKMPTMRPRLSARGDLDDPGLAGDEDDGGGGAEGEADRKPGVDVGKQRQQQERSDRGGDAGVEGVEQPEAADEPRARHEPTTMASAWTAELKPMSRLSTPCASSRSDSSGQARPVINPTIEMQPVAAATPRRRSAAVKVISDTGELPLENARAVLAEGRARGQGCALRNC